MPQEHVLGTLITALATAGMILPACSEGPGTSAKKLERQGDEPLVVYVDAPGEEKVEFIDEVEPNDEPAKAPPLAIGQGVHGSLDGEKDRDLYAIEVVRDGHLRAQVSGIEGVDLILELLDAQGEVVAISDRGPALIVEGLPNVHVTAGNYYLAVSEFVKKRRQKKKRKRKKKGRKQEEDPEPVGRQGPSPIYDLVVTSLPDPLPPRNEVEPNESRELANELLLGDEVLGFVGWARDTDVWKLSLEGFASHYGLNMELEGVPGIRLDLTVFNERGEEVLSRQSSKGGRLAVENLVVVSDEPDPLDPDVDDGRGQAPARPADAAAGYYYAAIQARRSNPLEPYRLRMHTRLLEPDQEIEPNDKPDQAVIIADTSSVETRRLGWLSQGDVDHYTLEPGADAFVLAVTCAPLSDIDVVLEVKVDGATLAESDEYKRSGKESLVEMRIQAGQRVTMAVRGRGDLDGESRYELILSSYPLASALPGAPRPDDLPDDRPDDLPDDVLDEYGDEPE